MYDSDNFGISDDYEYHEFCLDSQDSTQAWNGSYTNLNWPQITLGKELENVVALKVLQVIVPKTYYNVTAPNNVIQYQRGSDTNTPDWMSTNPSQNVITIPPGLYTTRISLRLLIAAGMNFHNSTYAPADPATFTSGEFTGTFKNTFIGGSSVSDKTYILAPGTTLDRTGPEVTESGRTNMRRVLGMYGGAGPETVPLVAITNINPTGPLGMILPVYRGPQVWGGASISKQMTTTFVDEIEVPTIYLNSTTLGPSVNLFLNGCGIMIPPGSGATGPQLCSINVPQQTNPGENIIYTDPDPQKYFKFGGNQKFPSSFDLYLTRGTDPAEIPLDLNGGSFVVKLGVLTSKSNIERSFPSSTGGYARVTKLVLAK